VRHENAVGPRTNRFSGKQACAVSDTCHEVKVQSAAKKLALEAACFCAAVGAWVCLEIIAELTGSPQTG
jgi:hypothetical protein